MIKAEPHTTQPIYNIMIITPFNPKNKISRFPITSSLINSAYTQTISKLFKEFRMYSPIIEQAHPKADFSYERCLYMSILEWKFQSDRLHPNIGHLKEFLEGLQQNLRGIELVQAQSQTPIRQTQGMPLIQKLRDNLQKCDGQTDLSTVVWAIPRLDYVLILIFRKIIKFGSVHSPYYKPGPTLIWQKLQPLLQSIRRLSETFRQAIILYIASPDYKQPQFQNAAYIGISNSQLYTFYTFSSKPQIQLKEEKTISLNSLDVPGQKSILKSQNLYLSSQVISEYCALCNKLAEMQKSLHWNYKIYCKQCILSPKVELHMIPPHKIQAYIRENKLQQPCIFTCPNCLKKLNMYEYNPASKPHTYKCSQCHSSICIKHQTHANICFCHCGKCRIPTFVDERIKLKICLRCKQLRCENCGDNKCSCRCRKCYEVMNGQHRCEKDRQCHQCLNIMKCMLQCPCGAPICKSCSMATIKADGQLKCPRLTN